MRQSFSLSKLRLSSYTSLEYLLVRLALEAERTSRMIVPLSIASDRSATCVNPLLKRNSSFGEGKAGAGSSACQMLPNSDELLNAMAWNHPGCRFERQRSGSRVLPSLVGAWFADRFILPKTAHADSKTHGLAAPCTCQQRNPVLNAINFHQLLSS